MKKIIFFIFIDNVINNWKIINFQTCLPSIFQSLGDYLQPCQISWRYQNLHNHYNFSPHIHYTHQKYLEFTIDELLQFSCMSNGYGPEIEIVMGQCRIKNVICLVLMYQSRTFYFALYHWVSYVENHLR